MLCMVGWFMCTRRFGPFLVHPWLVLVCIMVLVTFCFLVLPACTRFGVALPSWASPLGLACLFGSLPLGFLLRRWLVFRWAVCTFGVVWARCPPDAMDCSRWAFAFGVHGVLSWWATAAAALAAPSLCAVYLGAVQIKVHTSNALVPGCWGKVQSKGPEEARSPGSVRSTRRTALALPRPHVFMNEQAQAALGELQAQLVRRFWDSRKWNKAVCPDLRLEQIWADACWWWDDYVLAPWSTLCLFPMCSILF